VKLLPMIHFIYFNLFILQTLTYVQSNTIDHGVPSYGNICQNNLFCVPQKTKSHRGLERHEGEGKR